MSTSIAVGIDLGTTYSCVAAWYNGKVRIIQNEQGNTTTPSFVAYTAEKRLFGEAAKNQVSHNPLIVRSRVVSFLTFVLPGGQQHRQHRVRLEASDRS
jgi:molecular chaperone DnaK (HSP70)